MESKIRSRGQSGLEPGLIHRIRNKARYGLLIQEFLDRLQRLGLRFEPYYLEREGLFEGEIPSLETGFEEYQPGFLSPEEARAVSGLEERKIEDEKVLEWLKTGLKCFGVRYKGEVVSYVWCNFRECHYYLNPFPLKENEAYLFNSYTIRAHRGKNIAPYTRYRLYKELARTGRTNLYSITTYFNTSSRRFKEKLNARPAGLYFYVGLFKKWGRNFQIAKFGKII
jgi:Acetyltransferase (GNAT) family